MATRSPFTPEQEQEALNMFRQGMSTSEVFRSFGAKSLGSLPSYEIERRAIAGTQKKSIFNAQAAGEEFTKTTQDLNVLASDFTRDPSLRTAGELFGGAVISGGTSIPRAAGAGVFGSDVGQAAVSPVVEGMTRFGQAITPAGVQDVIGDIATQVIEGFDAMDPVEKARARTRLNAADVLSYFVGGKVAQEAVIAPTMRVGENVGREVMRGIDSLTLDRAAARGETGAMPDQVTKSVVSDFDTAIKPNLASKQTPAQRAQYESAVTETVQSISDNLENLRFFDDTTGETVVGQAPRNLKEFVDALEQTKQNLFRQYDTLAQQTGDTGVTLDVARLANDLDEVLNNRSLSVSNPDAIKYAETVQDRLRQVGTLSPADAQEVIKQFNNSLESFYRNPTPEGLSRQAVDALVANRLRQLLDEEVQAITGGAYQQLKNRYGALSAVERDIMRAYNRDARRNVRGLIDFTDVFTGGQVVSGILSMNPAAIAQGVVGKGIASVTKMLNDPNRRIRKMFERATQYRRPDSGFNTPTRMQLPAADPNAPRSEVTGGAPIPTGGQTPRGRVETGLTERTREGAVRQPEGEARPTEVERAIREDDDAVNQAISEMEAEMSGDVRPSVGENMVKSADGSYYRFNELPSWIPENLRDSDLMGRVMANITSGKKPRANAELEKELQTLVEQRIKTRKEEIKKGKGDTGVFSGDVAFAAALMAGGTYFLMSEDSQMLPVVAVGSIMANPASRKAALKNARRIADSGAKIPETYKRKIAEALEDYDAGFIDVKEGGVKRSIAPDEIDQRIAELQERNYAGKFTNKDALEAEELMANKGIIIERGNDQ